MTAEQWQRIKGLFDRAREHGPDQREALLREACAGDDALYNEVVTLLQACEAADALWGSKSSTAGSEEHLDRMEGRRIGPYRILKHIGSGGMGSVYKATRADGEFCRLVAI